MTISYSYRTITVPGATGAQVEGLNDFGVLSGTATLANGNTAAWQQPLFGTPTIYGADGSLGGAVNRFGEIAGTLGSGDQTRGFLLENGKFTAIDGPNNAYLTWGYGVNDEGEVVGQATTTAGSNTQGYVWQNGTMSLFSVPDTNSTTALDINDRGEIVGYSAHGNPPTTPGPRISDSGFIDQHGTITTFNVSGAESTQITAVNNEGDFAGSYLGSDSHWHGFIDHGSQMTFINAPGAADTWVTSMNDFDQVAGYTDTTLGSGVFQGFVATEQFSAEQFSGHSQISFDPLSTAHSLVGHV